MYYTPSPQWSPIFQLDAECPNEVQSGWNKLWLHGCNSQQESAKRHSLHWYLIHSTNLKTHKYIVTCRLPWRTQPLCDIESTHRVCCRRKLQSFHWHHSRWAFEVETDTALASLELVNKQDALMNDKWSSTWYSPIWWHTWQVFLSCTQQVHAELIQFHRRKTCTSKVRGTWHTLC